MQEGRGPGISKFGKHQIIKEEISHFNSNFIFTIIGVLLGILSLLAAVYYATSYEKKPSIKFDILSDANVLELREQIGKLSILYDNENISEKGLNLRMLTFRIENDGKVDILEQHYASSEPWGFIISEGRIIETNILESNSSYLQSKIHPVIHQPDTVVFDKTIFEQNKFITLKVLIIHNIDKIPQLVPIGKIAGIEKIPISNSFQSKVKPGYWKQLSGGPIIVQMGRGLFYGILLIILILIIVVISIIIKDSIDNSKDKKKKLQRGKIVEEFKTHNPGNINIDDIIFNLFVETGESLGWLSSVLGDVDSVEMYFEQYKRDGFAYPDSSSKAVVTIGQLIDIGAISEKKGIIEVDTYIVERINKFLQYLEKVK